ncbi:MAG: helix-turn-helix domain-containing protein [Bacteroidaceae bacterium]|nr:helix-turn-helix domain-containing protein [Bacteroidaceae bacterium]
MKRVFVFFIFLWNCIISVWSQNGVFFTSDKISNTNITSICQDKSGYIWIGTENGLNRFDGYKFTVYKNLPQDSTSLMFNIVNKVFCDTDGNLWVGTNIGVQRYDDATDSFVRYNSPLYDRSRITDICQLPDGKIVVGTAGFGLFRIDVDNCTLIPMKNYEADSDDKFFSHMLVDANGNLWKDGNKYFGFIQKGKRPQLFNERHAPPMAFADADGKVLVMNSHLLSLFDNGTFHDDYFDVTEMASLNPHYWTVMRDHVGNIYIGTRGNGLLWIPKGSRKVQHYKFNVHGINMNTSTVQTLFEDRQGNIWIGCWHKGLLVIPGHKPQFTSWSFSGQKHDIGNFVSSLCQGDNGIIWCSVRGEGIFGFDHDGQLIAHPASPAWVEFINRDSQGNFYVGAGTEVYAYNPQNGQVRQLISFPCNVVNNMADDGRGHIYFSVFGRGMLSYDTANGSIRHFSQNSYHDKHGGRLCNDWIMSMATDSKGNIWLATTNGVCCYDGENFMNAILEGKRCESLCETIQGDMLIGTMEGLYVWRRKTNKVEEFPNAGRLRGFTISYIVQDRLGDIWCSTTMGIWHYRMSDSQWVSHISGFGLTDKEFIPNAGLYIPQSDRIFFATSDGLTTFTPKQVQETSANFGEIRLTNMFFGGKRVTQISGENHQESTKFSFPYGDNVISMEFSLMNFIDAANTVFEYRLSHNSKWTRNSEGQNTITFAHLPIGSYQLEVRAIVGGVVSASHTYTIIIDAPWYRTTFAYILYVLGILGVIALIGMKWRNRVRMRLAMEKLSFMHQSNHNLRTSGRHHILIVGNDVDMANSIISELNTQYKFDYALNGKEALKMMLTNTYNLVVSDVMMPVMDGITMLKRIKSNTTISDIPVIILSSKEEVEQKLLGFKAGADAYIAKPVDWNELQIRIDSLIDNRLRLRGKFSGAVQQEERMENIKVKGNDDALMDRIMRSINAHISDPEYNVDILASDVGLSRAQLHRKMKEMTGIATGRFLRNLRMEQAARLLREGKVNVSQIADKVGYIDQTHFYTAFKTHFGMSPSEYMDSKINR